MSRKSDLRAELLGRRRAMPASARAEADARIVALMLDQVRGLDTVCAYRPMADEPGGGGLLDALAAVVTTVLLPVMLADHDLDWVAVDHGAPAGRATNGPALAGPALAGLALGGPRLGPDAIRRAQAVIVPALAIDRTGGRLGRGGGSYDRALTRVAGPCPVLALVYESELVDAVPVESHDRGVTAVVRPSGVQFVASPREPRQWTHGPE